VDRRSAESGNPRRIFQRAIFLTVLHRLFAPGVGGLDLHQPYQAMAWLGEVLLKDQQDGATPFAPCTNKDLSEEELLAWRRDLFSDLDIVFLDTTSIYFEGKAGETMGGRGHSQHPRPDRKQMVVGMVLDQNGYPICSALWPGNTAGVKSLRPIMEQVKSRFGIGSACIVAHRGMIRAETLAEVDLREWHCIRPYVVCVNENQAKKDRHDREAVAWPPCARRCAMGLRRVAYRAGTGLTR
jgi:hypothetical protein